MYNYLGHFPHISPTCAPPHIGPITTCCCPPPCPPVTCVGVGIIAIAILILIALGVIF
jgi:hypothetical protein